MTAATSALSMSSPEDPGLAALTVDEVLEPHAGLIARIKLCYGSDQESFEREVMVLVRRYAAYVHLLPATPDNFFSTPGGLLRLGLEVGFFSLQGTDAHIFSGRSTISTRRLLEPRWRRATFIAGLCCEVHRVFSHLTVIDEQGEIWSGYLRPLADWLKAKGAQRYFLRWRSQAAETRSLGIFALPHLVPSDVTQYLSHDNTLIVAQMMASVSGMPSHREHNVLEALVRRSLALVIDRNLASTADRNGTPQFGAHLERYLVEALRRLTHSSSAWAPNREKSRVWFGEDGLFLLWPNAAEDVQKLFEFDQLQGLPKTPDAMLEILLAAEVLEAQDEKHPTWTILPPGAKTELEAVKLTSAAILFAGMDHPPIPLDAKLVRRSGESDSRPPSVKPAAQGKPGEQLPLIPPATELLAVTEQPALAPELQSSAIPAPAAPPVLFMLQAPMRLNSIVRDALKAIVHSLNDGAGPAQCCTVANGLFVPLNELERRGVQPSIAMRALGDVRMLVAAASTGPPTLSRDFNGTATVGLVIDPRFIAGFDLDGFVLRDRKDH